MFLLSEAAAGFLYEQQLTNLKLQGKRPATIDAYSRAVRRIIHHFNKRLRVSC
ncbi:hypothetical protein L4D77_18565 [Photobacterium frigidiphilum]|uniref:hypothetical protein n=1 Tax=Photobacterium frigidiphilum TaxID=264736 RepID=UPI003D0FF2EA